MVADKSVANAEIDALLIELGNTGKTLPFFAIFPSDGGEPITFDGPISQGQIVKALLKAGPSKEIENLEATAMNE